VPPASAAAPPGVGPVRAPPSSVAFAAPVVQAVAVLAGGGSCAGVLGKVLYWLLERCQYSILVAFASILKILQYPGGCQYTGSGGQYTGSGCLTYCHYMAVRLVLLQCFGVLH
jgi:hypothetical protein